MRKINDEKVKLTYAQEEDPWWKKFFIESVEYLTGRGHLERLYNEAHAIDGIQHEELWKTVLDKLELNLIYDEEKLNNIPSEGPVVMIANHPYGVVDGLIFGYLAALRRKKFKILVNGALQNDHMLNDYLLPVDFRETKEAMMINIQTKNNAIKMLQENGCILIFPGGGVMTAPKVFDKPVDYEWKRFVLKLISKSKASVVPIYFHGYNSKLFHLASFISMNFRAGMLLNEIRNKIGKDIKISIGDPLPYEELSKINRKELVGYLQKATYKLEKEE